MSQRIGLFGGTFDPPHLGHLILASEAQSQLELDRLLWILTPEPPHKLDQLITPTKHRLAMVQLAIADNPAFELSRVEVDRPGPHYTLNTIRLIAEQNPGAEIILIIGGDSLRDLPTWREPREIVAACHEIGVMKRPHENAVLDELEHDLPGIRAKIRYVDTPLLEIASRELRNRIAEGRSVRYYLPTSVREYIEQKRLYN
ncbi:MAG: nicotinate (nicotinamide) nucleotide adenylyltransferase [Anaerolineales bacterium]|nr:nicotinate (nicotinamide) nucleotide adenylyltransferase [Anaerolineales bacterium]MCL4260965.1 nicotinate-nucleotide adenylyltransferase [Anaerolineales bacterium]